MSPRCSFHLTVLATRAKSRHDGSAHLGGGARGGQMSPRTGHTERSTAGFTLVELMVTIVIAAVLAALAVVSIRPERQARSARGYAEQVAALLDTMRIRATTTRRWQRLEVYADRVAHLEAETEGMAVPSSYYEVETVAAPSGVRIGAVSDRTHLAPGDSVPSLGAGLGTISIDLAPDGSAVPGTIFVEREDGSDRYRVTVFRATGAARVFADW
ncbi:MAG: prepilin-type N-terminal cleavage/methylation domain-containing protein [Deltaproteobacteria bacterium]|nr:MAG: prepilin-type N-terminal cleavage/methylation domain-containing protein [Deltaproteobacteria bacterium]